MLLYRTILSHDQFYRTIKYMIELFGIKAREHGIITRRGWPEVIGYSFEVSRSPAALLRSKSTGPSRCTTWAHAHTKYIPNTCAD